MTSLTHVGEVTELPGHVRDRALRSLRLDSVPTMMACGSRGKRVLQRFPRNWWIRSWHPQPRQLPPPVRISLKSAEVAGRDEYAFGKRLFGFGDLRYLHDQFKQISYLLSPTAGVGCRFVDTAATALSASVGIGGVWEKDTGRDVQTSGAVTADQRLSHKLSGTATVTEALTGLWKTSEFADALYTFRAGIAVSIVSHAQAESGTARHLQEQAAEPGREKERHGPRDGRRVQVLRARLRAATAPASMPGGRVMGRTARSRRPK